MTQTELGKAAGTSQRMIAYYELESAQPPGALLVDLARALKVSTDELLGLAPMSARTSPKTARLLKRLRRIDARYAATHGARGALETKSKLRVADYGLSPRYAPLVQHLPKSPAHRG